METRIAKGYADTSIGQMHYRQAGEGRNLLLLHSTPSCSEMYEPLMSLLAPQGFRTIAVDSPGFGMSPWLPRPFTIGDVATVMIEVMDYLQIKTTSIFGQLTGASIACEIASTKPRRVEKLILLNPVNFDAAVRSRRLAAQHSRIPIREDGSHLKQMWGRGLISLEDKHRSLVWRLSAEPRVIEYPHAVYSYDMASRLPRIKAPTLVMVGEHQNYPAELTARLIKVARHHIIPGDSMRLVQDRAEEVARITRDFLLESVAAVPRR